MVALSVGDSKLFVDNTTSVTYRTWSAYRYWNKTYKKGIPSKKSHLSLFLSFESLLWAGVEGTNSQALLIIKINDDSWFTRGCKGHRETSLSLENKASYSFKYNQQDAPLYNILHCCRRSTCFRRVFSHHQELTLYTQHLVYDKHDRCYC